MEIVAVLVGAVVANIGALFAFAWRYNTNYLKDKESQAQFLNSIKAEFMEKFSKIEQQRLTDRSSSALNCSQKEADHNEHIHRLENELSRDREMSNRDIKELNDKVDNITEKMEETQESISIIHRRIDELFKMLKSKPTAKLTITKKPISK